MLHINCKSRWRLSTCFTTSFFSFLVQSHTVHAHILFPVSSIVGMILSISRLSTSASAKKTRQLSDVVEDVYFMLFLNMLFIDVESNHGLSPREVTQQTLPHPAPPPLLQHAHVFRDKIPRPPDPPYNKPHVITFSISHLFFMPNNRYQLILVSKFVLF